MPRHLPSQRTRQCEETSGRLACDVRGKQAPLHCNIEPVTDVRSSRYSRNFSCQGNSSVTMLINMIALKIRATTLEEINCCQFRKLVQRSRSIHHPASMCTPQYTSLPVSKLSALHLRPTIIGWLANKVIHDCMIKFTPILNNLHLMRLMHVLQITQL
ncbi:hypothetical protein PABG_12222 [Paracoccidioides brasiliensis Pb03]|nr:hypothetical protein PABG_12222 [Paracoccidioides brasiliensis Pb03]